MYAQEEYPCSLKSKRFPPQPPPTKKGKKERKRIMWAVRIVWVCAGQSKSCIFVGNRTYTQIGLFEFFASQVTLWVLYTFAREAYMLR